MEKVKNNLFIKLGNFFFAIGFNYSVGGIKGVYRYYCIAMKLKLFKWRYKHSKKFRDNLIKDNDHLSTVFSKSIIEGLFFNKPVDYKAIYNRLSDEEKVKFKTNMEEALQRVIKEHNITDEKEIENLRKMFDFESEIK